MQNDVIARRTEMIRGRVRKLVRKGAKQHLRRLLEKVRPEEVPILMTGLTEDESLAVFGLLHTYFPESIGEVLTGMEVADRRPLVESLTDDQIVTVVEGVEVDDAVELVENLSSERRESVMDLVEARKLSEVQDHLLFEDDTAGRIMTTEFFALPQSTTIREAIASIQSARDVEMIFYVFVTGDNDQLVGVTSLRQLLLGKPDHDLASIMTRSVVKVTTDADQERVAELATRYDLLAIPVVDGDDRLAGIITVDDIMDVVHEEANEDFFKMAGTSDDELLYEGHSWRVVGIRLPWILVNGLGLMISGHLLTRFQIALKDALFLLAFVPVIMGIGGNVGSQTSTVAVRSIASGRLRRGQRANIRAFLAQQLRVGLGLGLICATLAAGAAYLVEQNPVYSGVVALSLFLVIFLAAFNGALAPLVFDRLGVDPAVAASPLVTTTSDITGTLIYFGLAFAMIDWLVR